MGKLSRSQLLPRRKSRSVLPAKASPEAQQLLDKTLRISQISEGCRWVLEKVSNGQSAQEALEEFLERYESKVMQYSESAVRENTALFRAALVLRCTQVLPFYGVRLAEKGVNAVFLQTWLRKRLLAIAMGITPQDVELKIRHSDKSPPIYLETTISELLPKTCLRHMAG